MADAEVTGHGAAARRKRGVRRRQEEEGLRLGEDGMREERAGGGPRGEEVGKRRGGSGRGHEEGGCHDHHDHHDAASGWRCTPSLSSKRFRGK